MSKKINSLKKLREKLDLEIQQVEQFEKRKAQLAKQFLSLIDKNQAIADMSDADLTQSFKSVFSGLGKTSLEQVSGLNQKPKHVDAVEVSEA